MVAKPKIAMPPDQSIVVDNVVCGEILYNNVGWKITAIIELSAEAEGRLTQLPAIYEYAELRAIYVTSRGGSRRIACNLERGLAQLIELRIIEECEQQYAELVAKMKQLARQRDRLHDLPITMLDTMIQEANLRLKKLSWNREVAVAAAASKAVQAVGEEIQRLRRTDSLELLLDALMEQQVGTGIHAHNQDVLDYLERLILRGAGDYVSLPSLREFYRERLKAAGVKKIADLNRCDPRLNVEDYTLVFEDDPEIDWAPTAIPYPRVLESAGALKLNVEYAYKGEGEQRQAVACVVIPFQAFGQKDDKRAALAALADCTLLPELTHGHLKWWVRIEGSKKSAEGFQGEALAAEARNLPSR